MTHWIDIKEQLPEYGQLCDIWVGDTSATPHRRIDHLFVKNIGVDDSPAFQPVIFNTMGLYEMAYFLRENAITHWMPSPTPPNQ